MKTPSLAFTALVLFAGASFAADAPAPAAAYPLTTCVVSGEKLGTMGKAYVFKHEGREVQLCCKSCIKDFNKDPQKFLKKLDEASKPKA